MIKFLISMYNSILDSYNTFWDEYDPELLYIYDIYNHNKWG